MKKFVSFSLVLLFSLMLFFTGCTTNNSNKNDVKDKDIVTAPEEQEEKKISIIDLESNSRPYAITVNNYPSAVKVQAGLQDAYLVYEIIVEGGLSRSLAFYKDKAPARIGTVRSARHNFLDYVMENDAIFAHFGWSHYAQDQIKQLGINNLDGNTSDPQPFWRENPEGLAWEHTVYGNMEKVIELAKTKGYRQTSDRKTLLNYTTDIVDLGKINNSMNANNVLVTYSSGYKVNFTYDTENKVYKRYVNGVAHTDYFTKEHYTAKNIIVTNIKFNYTSDGTYLDLHLVGTGSGHYITNGKAVPITWTKASRDSQTVYKYLNGEEIEVSDGNTYIMVTNQGASIN